MKGFVAFEAATFRRNFTRYTFHNLPELASHLHLYVRSAVDGWQREVSVAFSDSFCEQWSRLPEFNFSECSKAPERNDSAWYGLGDVSIDFGPSQEFRYELLVNDWPRRVSLMAQLRTALLSPPASIGPNAPALIRALPTPIRWHQAIDASILARILAWSDDYYAPLGLDGTILYVLPLQLADLQAHSTIQAMIASNRLSLVLWDDLSYFEVYRRLFAA